MRYRWITALAVSSSIATGAALLVDRRAPPPTASVALGTEGVFGSGLDEREQGQTAIRWTKERALFRFRHLPGGPATVIVEVRAHRDWVAVLADGRTLGTIAPGETAGAFAVGLRGGRLDVELRVAPFAAGARSLGTQLGHVSVFPPPTPSLDVALWLAFAGPAIVFGAGAVLLGWSGLAIAVGNALLAGAQAALLMPWGVVRSSYTEILGLALAVAIAGAAGLSWLAERRVAGAGQWALAAALGTLLVQGAAATWPAMIVSDALLHAHNLEKVAAGNWWLISRTQHDPPFEFPYGVSFYAPLVPFAKAGLDPVAVVRVGAAAAGLLMSAAFFWMMLPLSAPAAAASVLALQILPGTFDRYSYGNLSNVFGQAMTALLFAWWARGGRGGPLLGAACLVLAGLGHLSSMIVVVVLTAALLAARRGWGDLPRSARVGVLVAMILAVGYYATFLPLVLEQAPRLLEGGQGRGASRTLVDILRRQWSVAWGEWGWPALLLAFAGRPRTGEGLDRDLRAFWAAGAVLALLAIVSPVEVRYVYSLTLPLAVAMGQAVVTLARGGAAVRLVVFAAVAAQIGLAAANVYDDLYLHYRP
jgi:hypothetical protein